MKTEFGRGYATCLYLFLGHTRKLGEDVRIYRTIAFRDAYFTEAHALEMWANGAADHLIDLSMPRRKVTAVEKRIAKGIADRAYATGRQYMGGPVVGSEREARETLIQPAQRLLRDAASHVGRRYPRSIVEAVAIDADLGLKADPGGYTSCFRKSRAAA